MAEEKNDDLARQLEKLDILTESFAMYKNKLIEKKYQERQFKMTNTKYLILRLIFMKQCCMVVDIARKLRMSSGATTIALNQLEEEQLIVRVRSEEDRRIVWITLSGKGRILIQQIIETRNQFQADMLETLTDDEREQLFTLMGKISKRLNEKMEADEI